MKIAIYSRNHASKDTNHEVTKILHALRDYLTENEKTLHCIQFIDLDNNERAESTNGETAKGAELWFRHELGSLTDQDVASHSGWLIGNQSRLLIYCSSDPNVATEKATTIRNKLPNTGNDNGAVVALALEVDEFKKVLPALCQALMEGKAAEQLVRYFKKPPSAKLKREIADFLASWPNKKMPEQFLVSINGDLAAELPGTQDYRSRPVITGITSKAMSLRGKVSHSWLDHEIRGVPNDDLVVQRWRDGSWAGIRGRWASLYALAQALENEIHGFYASSLVSSEFFPRLNETELGILKVSLDKAAGNPNDLIQRKATYSASLTALWQATETFFKATETPCSGALSSGVPTKEEKCVRDAWKGVKTAAERLKDLFDNGTIPNGVLLP